MASPVQTSRIWPAEQAATWYARQGWLVGCNFIPSTAINELEMWQADTFDPTTIHRELSLAESLGMNAVRVYLHNLAWETDADGFKERIHVFLDLAELHHIKVIFVLFDDCWNENPHPGKQPEPQHGVHNSGWLQAPGKERLLHPETWGSLEAYVQDILRTFDGDERVLLWDLYNEPGNSGYLLQSMPLLQKAFEWAWAVRPSQPLTSAPWNPEFTELNAFQLDNSDVLTFHNYMDVENLEAEIRMLQERGRPIICTEYMARTLNSRFDTHLAIFKRHNIGAINWGLVAGKTNTIYPWKTVPDMDGPVVWFHDIFYPDGSVYDPKEAAVIRAMTGAAAESVA